MRHVLVVCVVLALGLVACAGDGDTASPEERLANAADATADEGTAAFSMNVSTEMGGDDDGEDGNGEDGGSAMSMSFSGEGVMDFEEEVGRMEMELPGMGMATETVFDQGAVYTQIPSMAGTQEQWVRQGGDEQAHAPGMDGDPAGMVEVVDAVEGDIEELGSETIRGTDVDGFGFTVAGSELAQGGEDVPEGMADADVPMEVWLDAEDRVRRMVMEIDMGSAVQSGTEGEAIDPMGGDMPGVMTVTMEFYDFGTEVDVEVPSDEDVVDPEDFQRQMEEGMQDMEGMPEDMEGLEGSGQAPSEESEEAEASEE